MLCINSRGFTRFEELLKPSVLEILDHPAIVTRNVSGYNTVYITESGKVLSDTLEIAGEI